MTKKTKWYIMSVLAYYRSEWTEVSDKDKGYRLLVTSELERLIRTCMRRGVNVPNAAKEVEIFLDLQEARADAAARNDPGSLPKGWQIDIKSSSSPLRVDPKPDEPDDESEA
jgi:hypothetical protein